MAEIKQIFFHQDADKGKRIMRVYGIFRAIGEKMIEVTVPERFYDSLMDMAQCGLDSAEAQMRAGLIGEINKPESKGGS